MIKLEKEKCLRWIVRSGLCLCTLFFCSCDRETKMDTLFLEVSPERSGITFSNTLTENDSINYFNYMYIYMGGGVAVGDLNNDGLPDIYFTGNMVKNKLYLNQGNLGFKDVTEEAGVGGDNRWMTGVTMGDANQDGWLDIYVSVSGKWGTTENLLYINDAKEGELPTFTESAKSYGVADAGNGTQAVFFDYDRDGDQDLYVVNYPLVPSRTSITEFLDFRENTPAHRSDRMYRNNGDRTFTDVTQESGMAKYGLSLGISVGDYNQDGWPDVYVSNDFSTPDYFLMNNGDGTFTDRNLELTNHTSYFGMGTDAADFNNDGLLDIYQVDMMPKSHRRAKENMDSMDPERFYNMVAHDMHHQYSINTLQMNMGNDSVGLPHFGDVGKMAGVSATDWSWAALFADFDNDGQKDIYVSNGVRRDINNSDFFRSDEIKNFTEGNSLELTLKLPSEKIENYAFKNNGDLTFSNVSKEWGLNYNGFSNGMVYADLDLDGDLDVVLNNLDDKSRVYENRASQQGGSNHLRIKFKGPDSNAFGIGCKVWLEDENGLQFQEMTLTRGFQSSVEPVLHFGVGKKEKIAQVKIQWPDGRVQKLNGSKTNRLLVVDYRDAVSVQEPVSGKGPILFKDITREANLNHKHEENLFNDFYHQVLLPHKISQYGPALAVGDVDNDGLDDFFVGGAYRSPATLYRQNGDGTFAEMGSATWELDREQEDVAAEFFDANGDGLLDLYVVSGGNEFGPNDDYYQDRFYLNRGNGVFEKIPTALPRITDSGGTVIYADYDADGDMDLFVGGRVTPRNYPTPPQSHILRNDSKGMYVVFTDVTSEVAPELLDLGMVTQAEWVDVDGDSRQDLMIVGEWMGIVYLRNEGAKFVDKSAEAGLEGTTGWWFGLKSHDFDGDGDQDFLVGNLGRNYKYQAKKDSPFSLYAYDYDNNNRQDIVLSYLEKGTQVPVRGRECSSQQIPAIKSKFKDYHSFASASLEQIYSTEHLEKSVHYEVRSFANSYLENKGKGQFELHELDNLAQIAPINGMVVEDIDGNGTTDVIYAGNLYGSEVETPRGDASYGGLLTGNGKGDFRAHMPYESGLWVPGEVRAVKKITLAHGKGVLFAKNNDYLQLVQITNR